MRYFQQLAAGIDAMPMMHALARSPELWNQNRSRTTFELTPHGEVDDIWIRFADASKGNSQSVMCDAALIWHPAYKALPVRKLLSDFCHLMNGYQIDRVLITRLRPGGRILPHTDSGNAYVDEPDRARYHIVLQGLPGSIFRAGDEQVCMRTGEAWWFDARSEHECINNSSDDRVHMLVDMCILL